MDFEALRDRMVEDQIVGRGVKDERVIAAMKRVPRHLFVPVEEQYRAYDDSALPIGDGQTISQPYMVAVMTELLKLRGDEKVLEIGTGSGYQAAVLAELAREVFTIERIPELKNQAEKNLRRAGYHNVTLRTSDGSEGWSEEAPFDRIIITAGSPEFPEPLIKQLGDGGIGVAPVGALHGQELIQITKRGADIKEHFFTPCIFVPLIGKYGWQK
jgi:protein-L-isoaspartate(D-aspartate) O-methyltransferase